MNYTGVAFLEYPNRQYVLNALPALVLGKSIFALHLGFAWPFLAGLAFLYLELRGWLLQKELPEEYALLPVYGLMVFPYITEYFLNFEQAITPVAFSLLGLGALLRFYRTRDFTSVLLTSWTGGMCCNAYTPVLAFFGLMLVFLGLWCISACYAAFMPSRHSHRKAIARIIVPISENFLPDKSKPLKTIFWQILTSLCLIIQLCCYFASTLFSRQKTIITTVRPEVSLKDLTLTAWYEFFTDTNAVFWGFFLIPVLLYLLLSFLGRLKLHDFLISAWMLITVFFSGYLKGYTSYEKYWEIQRNMVILPVFIVGIFFALLQLHKKLKRTLSAYFIATILLIFTLLGQYNFSREHQSVVYYRYVQPMKYALDLAIRAVKEQGLQSTDTFNLILLTDNSLQRNLYDYAEFFWPNANTFSVGTDTPLDALDFNSALETIIISEKEVVLPGETAAWHCKEYKNMRYHTTVSWYYLNYKN